MAEKAAKVEPVEERGVTEDGLPWKIVRVGAERFKVRAITVEESDQAYDASVNEDKTFNQRLNSRLELSTAIIEPRVTVDDIAKWPISKYIRLLREAEEINILPPADEQGND